MSIYKLKNLSPGERYVYFTGYLDLTRLELPLSDDVALADAAYNLYLDRKIHLTQKRLPAPQTGFEYIATGALMQRKYAFTEES